MNHAPSRRAINVAVVNDYETVVRGLVAVLAPFEERVRVVEADEADVVLFDTFAGRRHTLAGASEMVRNGAAVPLVLYTWDAAPELVAAAQEIGVAGIVLKSRSADVLVESLERVVRGERVGFDGTAHRATQLVVLSDRESEVLALIAKGLTNAQIADELYLSVETVKTYVKRLYAKLDVHNRAQAAIAASQHRLAPRVPG
jgi:DNA-binding NarL/FixJ family response regulator